METRQQVALHRAGSMGLDVGRKAQVRGTYIHTYGMGDGKKFGVGKQGEFDVVPELALAQPLFL